MQAATLRDSSVSLHAFSFFYCLGHSKNVYDDDDQQQYCAADSSERARFPLFSFLLFFQSLTLDARFNSLGERKCHFHSFVQISVSDYIVYLDRARCSRSASSPVNIFVIGN